MQRFFRLLIAFLLGASLLAPLSALAFVPVPGGLSFGGRLISFPYPCFGLPGVIGFTIRPAGRFSPFYVWVPGTQGLPPIHPLQQIIGTYGPVIACNGLPSFVVLYDAVGL